jgi:3'(2'), 5'-bisphosphate nucleotidase
MSHERELEAAREAAARAGREIMTLYADFEAIAQAPGNITTEADHRAQEIILHFLHAAFPEDAFIAEEPTATLTTVPRSGPRLWVIDPIDGTRGFARKNGEFSVMIGLVEAGAAVLGVVWEPARERWTWAVRGQGCWRADGGAAAVPCKVSAVDRPEQATLVQSRADRKTAEHSPIRLARRLYTYSAGIKLALVARGEADVYVSTYTQFNAWDLCAGQVLVEAAGGQVTDRHGRPIHYAPDGRGHIDGVIASNGLLHTFARSALLRSG